MQTVDQKLLAWAQSSVAPVANTTPAERAKYRTAVKGAPAFIQGCGLTQGIAFFQAKAQTENGYRLLLEHLEAAEGLKDLRMRVPGMEMAEYVFATRRTQASLVMLKRMVDAYLPRGEEEPDAD